MKPETVEFKGQIPGAVLTLAVRVEQCFEHEDGEPGLPHVGRVSAYDAEPLVCVPDATS